MFTFLIIDINVNLCIIVLLHEPPCKWNGNLDDVIVHSTGVCEVLSNQMLWNERPRPRLTADGKSGFSAVVVIFNKLYIYIPLPVSLGNEVSN